MFRRSVYFRGGAAEAVDCRVSSGDWRLRLVYFGLATDDLLAIADFSDPAPATAQEAQIDRSIRSSIATGQPAMDKPQSAVRDLQSAVRTALL
jgi:N-acetylmuramic acid 6-phosphate (MurNAc-6-P) etherase